MTKANSSPVLGLPAGGADELNDPQFIMALARGLELLRAFEPGVGPLGNKELAAKTGLPKPTVARIAHTLTRLGYLEYIARLEKYQLGAPILSLGYAYLGGMNIRAIAHPMMQEIADEFDASVGLGGRDRLDMVYIDVAQGANVRTLRLDIGSHVPIEKTAMGMAFFFALPEVEQEFLMAAFRRRNASEWPQTMTTIKRTQKEIAERGFCVVSNLYNRNITSAASPFVSADGMTVLSINCSAPVYQISEQIFYDEIGPRLHDMAQRLKAEVQRTRTYY